jgi:dTDP-4-amino-4,6-dideoxygalactose transaminase
MHPLKTLNVWGDGGVIAVKDDRIAEKLRLLRNHGLVDRNTSAGWGYNSRLDTVQAVVAHHVLGRIDKIVKYRKHIASIIDDQLYEVEGVAWAPMPAPAFATYYLYTFLAQQRDKLVAWLVQNDIEAKVHYPTPLHLQPAAEKLGYKRGAFPVAERLADTTVSLPCHEFIDTHDAVRMGTAVRDFYKDG